MVGEIVVKGPNVMAGYLNNPEATAATIRDGWLHTGDAGYVDPDGYFFIVDRAKDMIIRGGENIYPREIEEVLYAHAGVLECAVIGVPDEVRGEEVLAFVAPKPAPSSTAINSRRGRPTPRGVQGPSRFEIRAELPKPPPARSASPRCATSSATGHPRAQLAIMRVRLTTGCRPSNRTSRRSLGSSSKLCWRGCGRVRSRRRWPTC